MDSKLAPVSEREGKLKELLRDEETKKNINDSKFRAVAQKMDYEGFRQMVLGANLKPMKSGEMYSMTGQNRTKFNALSTNSEAEEKKDTSVSFVGSWRRCKSDAER